jgi:hypothetical protein
MMRSLLPYSPRDRVEERCEHRVVGVPIVVAKRTLIRACGLRRTGACYDGIEARITTLKLSPRPLSFRERCGIHVNVLRMNTSIGMPA